MSPAELEPFFRAHQYTLEALTAFCTLAAVITSIGIALHSSRQNRTRASAYIDVRRVVGGGISHDTPLRYIVVSVANKGTLPLQLGFSFFAWKIPLVRGEYLIAPMDHTGDQIYPKVHYPVTVAPRASHLATIQNFAMFESEERRMRAGFNAFTRFMSRWQRPRIYTEDGCIFPVKMGRSIRREMKRIRKESPTGESHP